VSEIYMMTAAILTSAAAYLVIRRRWRFARGSLRLAIRRTVECAGLSLLFFVGNLVVEAALVLLARALTGRFVTLYLAGDLMIVPISCLQGVAVWWWRDLARRPRSDEAVSSRVLPR